MVSSRPSVRYGGGSSDPAIGGDQLSSFSDTRSVPPEVIIGGAMKEPADDLRKRVRLQVGDTEAIAELFRRMPLREVGAEPGLAVRAQGVLAVEVNLKDVFRQR
jgi:hypothetical protein